MQILENRICTLHVVGVFFQSLISDGLSSIAQNTYLEKKPVTQMSGFLKIFDHSQGFWLFTESLKCDCVYRFTDI